LEIAIFTALCASRNASNRLKELCESRDDRIGVALAHLSFSNSIASSPMPRARRNTPLMVVFSNSTTPNLTG